MQDTKKTVVNIDPFTIVMTIGPTQVGKTTLVKQLVQKLEDSDVTHIVISSDVLRNQIYKTRVGLEQLQTEVSSSTTLGYDNKSQYNDIVFKTVNDLMECYTSHTVNIPVIILDTTGLSSTFRENVQNLADRNHYTIQPIAIDLKTSDRLNVNLSERARNTQDRQAYKLRKDVLKELTLKKYPNRCIITKREENWGNIDFVLSDQFETLQQSTIKYDPLDQLRRAHVVIGDIHEDVDAFRNLIHKVRKELDADKSVDVLDIILVGDYLDKGNQTGEMIHFLHEFVSVETINFLRTVRIVNGNHENYVYKRLKGKIDPNPEYEELWAQSVKVLLSDEVLREKFFDLYENHTVPFTRIFNINDKEIYVTHAPCDNIYIGKTDSKSVRNQSQLRIITEDIRESFRHIYKQADYDHALHVFGHVPHDSQKLNYRNKWFIDTGSVHGGKLTALVFRSDKPFSNPDIIQVTGNKLLAWDDFRKNQITPVQVEKPFDIDDYYLSAFEQRSLNRFIRSEAKFISGTMAPCSSSDGQLEPVENALSYYANKGVKKVFITTKYMGSRAQLYLFRGDPDRCFATSRSGATISVDRHPYIREIIENQHDNVETVFKGDWTSAIMDGELLPWAALGDSLIERDYYQYRGLITGELTFLANHTDILSELDFGFELNQDMVTRKYSHLGVFNDQLSIYGQPLSETNKPEFKFFNFLMLNDEIKGFQQNPEDFINFNGDDFIIADTTYQEDISRVREFFDKQVGNNKEGVVVRPYGEYDNKTTPPYLKVRNEKYLHLIYGYDYKDLYEEKIKTKNISGKVKLSINEANLGLELLDSSNLKRSKRTELAVKMICNIREEKKLDPRL